MAFLLTERGEIIQTNLEFATAFLDFLGKIRYSKHIHLYAGGNLMTPFMDQDFLLKNETAKKLYHEHASAMPIIDYHCHINPQ